MPNVTPLRADGLTALIGRDICAVVYDSDISMNYGPLQGSLKGSNLGTVAFRVTGVVPLSNGSSSILPAVVITILDAAEVCTRTRSLFLEAPVPSSSSPFDITAPAPQALTATSAEDARPLRVNPPTARTEERVTVSPPEPWVLDRRGIQQR